MYLFLFPFSLLKFLLFLRLVLVGLLSFILKDLDLLAPVLDLFLQIPALRMSIVDELLRLRHLLQMSRLDISLLLAHGVCSGTEPGNLSTPPRNVVLHLLTLGFLLLHSPLFGRLSPLGCFKLLLQLVDLFPELKRSLVLLFGHFLELIPLLQ